MTYGILLGSCIQHLLTPTENVDFCTIVLKSSGDHKPYTGSTAGYHSNKAIDGEEPRGI